MTPIDDADPPSARATPDRRRERPLDPHEAAVRTCPICGAELHEQKCKLVCRRPGCGYFLSCADYY